ncbi:hypothetical protein C2S52_013848 [Perilla frutescens var. hirtella]|nr:hypothetical protein C2S52_013848 [Perilla frutescens var. hirtella]
MEPQIFRNHGSTSFIPPEDIIVSGGNRFIPAANHHETPPITYPDQSIESAFSRLNLSSDVRLPSDATSSLSYPASIYGGRVAASPVSIPSPMAFGGNQQASIWAQAQISNASINGPFRFPGAHQELNVGPDFAGRGPYLHAGDLNQLMQSNQRQDFYGDTDNLERCSLHGKEPFSRNDRYIVPTVPFDRKNRCFSSRNSLYADQRLHKHQQHLTPENMSGIVLSLAKDQVWSEILNLKLEEGLREDEIEMILLEVMDFFPDLFMNQFGSQFVQKLFAVCNEDQRSRFIIALTKSPYKLITICLNSFGARAMQKLLEKLNTPQQISFVVASLAPGVFPLATDPNGQHVINYCVKRFPGEYTKHLLNKVTENCFKIATSKSGCCVLQSCVENSRGDAREQLIREIIENAVHLAEDPYGNYVVQHLIGMKMQEVTNYLLKRFRGCFVSLSCNKYASNVVEKLLESEEEVSVTIVVELLRSPNAPMLLQDPFGNFVIQSALGASKGEVYDLLYDWIAANAPSMQSNLYGKKILAWFQKKKLYKM